MGVLQVGITANKDGELVAGLVRALPGTQIQLGLADQFRRQNRPPPAYQRHLRVAEAEALRGASGRHYPQGKLRNEGGARGWQLLVVVEQLYFGRRAARLGRGQERQQ